MVTTGARSRLAALAVCLVLIAACGGAQPTAAPTQLAAAASATASVTEAPTLAPTPAPTATPRATLTPAVPTACPGKDSTPDASPGQEYRLTDSLWAGQVAVVKKKSISCVEGTWIQPKARCAINAKDSVFVGIGLDGFGANRPAVDATAAILMIGVESFCANGGRIEARAWKWSGDEETDLDLGRLLRVSENDRIWARILFDKFAYELEIVNLTNGTSGSARTGTPLAIRLTAEWVISTLQICQDGCIPAPLSNFDAVAFVDGAVSLDGGYRASIRDDKWVRARLTLEPKSTILAKTGPILSDGASFSIDWVHG